MKDYFIENLENMIKTVKESDNNNGSFYAKGYEDGLKFAIEVYLTIIKDENRKD